MNVLAPRRNLAAATIGAAALALSGCAFSLSGLAGPGNVAAMDAAVACDFDQALSLAAEERSSGGSETLFSYYVDYAVYTETGRSSDANKAIDDATRDPRSNPEPFSSRQEILDGGNAVLAGIRGRRAEATGSEACPS